MVGPFKVSSGQFPFHCSLGVSTRKARLAGVLHPVVDIVANWDVLSADAPSTAEAFISSLEEECFAKQIFQNDFAKGLQYNLLRICREYHRLDLEQHCRDLMQASSYTDPAESQN